MKLSCLQENLKRGLAIVGHAVAGKSTLPILSHILLATDDGRLKLAATNLEIGITCWIGAKVENEGAVAVPAKLLSDVVGSLPNDRIDLTLDVRTQTLNLKCARFETNIKGADADDFPTIPAVDDRTPVAVFPPALLRETIQQVAFAAATEETRPVLQGVQLRLRDNRAIFAAADGFRLAMRIIELPEPVTQSQELIIPARALNELARILDGDEEQVEMIVTPSGGQVLFHTSTVDLVSRLIDGKFPDVDRVIPQQYQTRAVLDTQELTKAVKLASYFAVASSNIVRLQMEPGGEMGPGRMTISANAVEVGDNKGQVDAMIQGEGGQIALNVKFLSDAIAAIPTPQVALETQSPQHPAVFKPVGADGYIHIVMPMTVR
ncbi:MAG: DNA polymerase III subunit beta [Roseiflexus sp.]|nr:DNA polymerase III subunit beta [Roseiflexus sp.]MCS7288912.1 DNA polymerase III subunit beta [Roseiflexus sp.]MDW8146148.1 DNA polymerase III subunit beta [Roseiflexaceae bacterium]MDW8234259.1 DNA polymerase III subunit beta [Roseiflexaceae bacterium]